MSKFFWVWQVHSRYIGVLARPARTERELEEKKNADGDEKCTGVIPYVSNPLGFDQAYKQKKNHDGSVVQGTGYDDFSILNGLKDKYCERISNG